MTQHKEYKSFKVGNCFQVVPENGHGDPDRINLIMHRGAFGSGEHETTSSCLEFIERLPQIQGSHLLDFGSGTGILAIAALKLGATHAVCVDINHRAIETAQLNFKLNNLSSSATHVLGNLDKVDGIRFELIFANIYADILIEQAQKLCALLKPQGSLLLSGILWEDNYEIRQSYEQKGLLTIKNQFLNEYTTMLLHKP